jgi:tRNA-dihydrouridine synthase B
MLKLKSLELKSRIISSPMAACTDLAYRLISREYGLEFCFLEMVPSESLIREIEATQERMKTVPEDKPLGAQLVGCRPEVMGEAASIVEEMGYDLLDLNLGCPVHQIAGKGAGSALLARPEECRQIFTAVIKNIKKIPVTVKMRLGVSDPSGSEAECISKIAEDCGISAVFVHGRTRAQGYSGTANYHAIRRVKEAVNIPVFGNGDVTNCSDAKKMIEVTGCDGIMIGRGGLGNPWIFKHVENVIAGKEPSLKPSGEEKKQALLRHLELELLHREERLVIYFMRRIAAWYFKGMLGIKEFRSKMNHADSIAEIRKLVQGFKTTNEYADGQLLR